MSTKVDPEKLRQEASNLIERAAAAQARLTEMELEKAARAAEQRAEADRELVASYRRAAYDQEVDDALQALEDAVRAMPVTQALGRYLYAQVRRYVAVQDLLAARGRLGMPTDGAQLPPSPTVMPLSEYVAPVAQRIATELADADRANTNNEQES